MVVEVIPSPKEFFGFNMGADRKLARWDKLVDYYKVLGEKSDRIEVKELGKTTEGNPFLLVIITSPANHRNIEDIRKIGPTLAYSEDLPVEDLESIVREGKAIVGMAMSIHASEVGGAQMAPELAYELATGESDEIKQILDEVVLLLIPSANPDGNIMVVDWYNKYLGTEYEGGSMPWLYHKYVGHDNNRDLPLMNMPETKMLAKLIFEDWFPIAYIDFHHYGSFGGRYYIPPFVNPTDPEVDPLLWTEQQLYGGAMILKLEQAGKTGVENYAGFTAEFNAAYTRVCTWHGICGMLTESASAKLATPMYVHYHQLQAARRGRPEYRTHVNFPHPWPGGWWRLRDIVEQQKVSAFAALEVSAKYRETFLRNLRTKAMRGRKMGETEAPYALIIPPNQHDPITNLKLLDALLRLGVKIHSAEGEFAIDGATYPEGSYIIFLSQIARPYILSTMRDHIYHESPWAKSPEGVPLNLQDISGYNMAAMMGSNIVEVAKPFEVIVTRVKEITLPEPSVGARTKHGYVLDGRLNNAFRAVNGLLKRGLKVHRVEEEVDIDGETLPKGAFYIQDQKGIAEAIEAQAETHKLEFHALENAPKFRIHELKPQRIAMYQRYYGGNMDEGWTRWLLEQYEFECSTVKDDEIKKGIQGRYDILIFPSDPTPLITGEKLEEWFEKEFKGMRVPPKFPPEYLSGIGEEGVEKVKEFVENGGILLLLNQASEFAIEALKMPIINTVKDLKPNDFHCPGSLLKTCVSEDNPLVYGVDEGTPVLFWGSPALQIKPVENSDDFDVVVSYPEENILRSGWLIGEKHLGRKAALIEGKMGKGRVILYGFRSQFRCQTHATFKYLFNALIR